MGNDGAFNQGQVPASLDMVVDTLDALVSRDAKR